MKKTFRLFVVMFFVMGAVSGFAQNPTYTLVANNATPLASITNAIEFDITMTWTGTSANYEYAGGQYFFNLNTTAIANGGTLSYGYSPTDSSDLPGNMRPRNPQIFSNGDGTSQMRLAVNTFPGAGSGYAMPLSVPVQIARMRVATTAPLFATVPFVLTWRNGPTNPFTKVFAYVGTTNTDISTPQTHSIDIDGGLLPVELASFTAVTNRNNVTLNWATSKETNNQGFDVERSLVGANSWAKVGTVTGNGTTNETKSYSFTERVTTGNYSYRLKQIDFNGNFAYHNLSSEVNVGVPSEFALSQNYPNPFNPSTKIDYDIATDGNVSVVLFDMSGREVAKLVNDFKTAGYYTVNFNASNLSSGMYFYRISANNFSQTKKMVLVK
jgi:hypothetical protein